MLLDITSMSGLITELGSIISACFTLLTSNWLFTGILVVAVGVPIVASIFSLIKNRA